MLFASIGLDRDPLVDEPAANASARRVEFRTPIAMPRNARVKVTLLFFTQTDNVDWAIRRGFFRMAIETISPECVFDFHAANGAIRVRQRCSRAFPKCPRWRD